MKNKYVATMNRAIIVLMSLLFSTAAVHADSDSPNASDSGAPTPTTAGTPTPAPRGHHGSQAGKQKPSAPSPGQISGRCSIIESPSNPFAGPCVSLVVILNDADGNEVFNTRTNSQGQFDFDAEPGKTYKIVVGSKSYEVISPKVAIRSGDQVSLQLQLK